MNCNLRVQAGPENKGEVTSSSWENREKFAASREKCFRTEDTRQKHGYIISSYEPLVDLFFLYIHTEVTPQKHGYIISSYEPLADLYFLYFNIGPNNNKTKINNQKKKKKILQESFFVNL